jgi:hypothetical protein
MIRMLRRAKRAVLRLAGFESRPVTLSEDLERRTTKAVIRQRDNLTFDEAVQELEHEKTLRTLERDIEDISAGTVAIGEQFLLTSATTVLAIEKTCNELEREQITGEILRKTHGQVVTAGVLAADTNLYGEQAANIKAQRGLEETEQQAAAGRLADAAQHLAALGPTEEERQRSEQDSRDKAWALSLADDASRMARKLKKKGPFTPNDRYYSYVAVQFYAARVEGRDVPASIAFASTKLFDLKKRQEEISDDDAAQFAERAHEQHQALSRNEADALRAAEEKTRQEQELEASRNNLQAAEKQHAAVEKLDTILTKGKNDGAHFDKRA